MTQIFSVSDQLPRPAAASVQAITRHQLLQSYIEFNSIEAAMRRITAKRPRFLPMLDSISFIEQNCDAFTATFRSFYPELQTHVCRQLANSKSLSNQLTAK